MLALTLQTLPVGAQMQGGAELPDMGSPADTVLTREQERTIALSVIEQFRSAGRLVTDPEINEYVSNLGRRLAYRAQNGDHQFHFFVVKAQSINAFALPGGYIGVHTGLIDATANESELAGVLAHEIAHVTQNHISRQIQAMRGTSIMTMATMLAALLVGGLMGGGGDFMQGALMAGTGMAQQQQINFTRAHEHEADRIGIGTLYPPPVRSPRPASFFETMSRTESLSVKAIPEILRTHPVNVNRMAEARARITPDMTRNVDNSLSYYLTRAQARLLGSDSPEEAMRQFRSQSLTETEADVGRFYGQGLALLDMGRADEAMAVLNNLLADYPDSIPLRIAVARAHAVAGDGRTARRMFEEALALFPGNPSLGTPLRGGPARRGTGAARPRTADGLSAGRQARTRDHAAAGPGQRRIGPDGRCALLHGRVPAHAPQPEWRAHPATARPQGRRACRRGAAQPYRGAPGAGGDDGRGRRQARKEERGIR